MTNNNNEWKVTVPPLARKLSGLGRVVLAELERTIMTPLPGFQTKGLSREKKMAKKLRKGLSREMMAMV